MEINLVSDTVTKPTYEMLQYMFNAQVGDDVQDPTVIELESSLAAMFGMEAPCFFPSNDGTKPLLKLHDPTRREPINMHTYTL
jgi:threonine aldolase